MLYFCTYSFSIAVYILSLRIIYSLKLEYVNGQLPAEAPLYWVVELVERRYPIVTRDTVSSSTNGSCSGISPFFRPTMYIRAHVPEKTSSGIPTKRIEPSFQKKASPKNPDPTMYGKGLSHRRYGNSGNGRIRIVRRPLKNRIGVSAIRALPRTASRGVLEVRR